MSTIDLRFEQDVAGLDRTVEGYGLAEEGVMDRLDEIATALGVLPLDAFSGQTAEELATLVRTGEIPDGPRPWFEPEEGLRTVSALLAHLYDHPEILPEDEPDGAEEDPDADLEPRENLARFEAALRAAVEQGVRFHIVSDF